MPLLCLAQLLLGPLISVPASSAAPHSASAIPCPSLALLRTYSDPLYPLGEPLFFFFLSQK